MDCLSRLRLLSQLTPVELAKLLPEIRETRLEKGERLEPDQLNTAVYFLAEGRLELRSEAGEQAIWLAQFGPGDIIVEATLLGSRDLDVLAVALERTHLVVVPSSVFQDLLREKPNILESFNLYIMARSADRLDELVRVRRMVTVYSEQLWSHTETEAATVMVAGESKALPPGTTSPLSRRNKRSVSHRQPAWKPSKTLLQVTAVTALSCAFALWPTSLLPTGETRYLLSILLWAALCWMLNALPDYVVALAACTGLLVTGIATPGVALSGFASPTWFLLMGTWCMGVAVSRTGLLYRVALHVLKLLPSTYWGRSLALAFTGTLVTPLLPSSQGRILMAAPLTLELSEAMRFSQRSNGSAGLAMASLLGFGQMYFLFLNGTTTAVLAWSLLPTVVKDQVTWFYWATAALPLGLIVFLLTYGAILRLYPVPGVQCISQDLIASQIRVLGPIRPDERTGLYVLLAVLFGFVSTPIHHIDPAWFAVGGMLILAASGVLDKQSLSREADWSFLLFFGAVISIANVARNAQLDATLGALVQPLLAPVLAHPTVAIMGVALLTLLLRLALSPIQVIPLLTITLIPIFIQAGYNPFGAVLTVVTASTTFASPMLSPNYVTMLAGTRNRMFTPEQVRNFSLIHSAVLLTGLLASIPYWLFIQAL